MGLTNYQYNQILREYDKRQLANQHALNFRYQKAYQTIPQLQELETKIASNSIEYTKQALLRKNVDKDIFTNQNSLLIRKKLQLLLQYGFPPDYLELQYHCSDCKDTGYNNGKKCNCFKQAIVNLLYSQSNLQAIIHKENFSTFSYDYYSKEAIEQPIGLTPFQNIKNIVARCNHFIKQFNNSYENLFLYGNTGVGKTFLTHCIAKELLDNAYTVIYLTSSQLFDTLAKSKFTKGEDQLEAENQASYILNCDLLIIDDLGTELNNNFTSSQLYLCIDERHLKQKSTIISTNLSLDELDLNYSERIFSRITCNYSLLKIIGEDIRLKKAFA